MNIRTFFVAVVVLTAVSAQAQTVREPQPGDFRIVNMRHSLLQAPKYSASGGQASEQPATLLRDWLRIEVQFETKQDWADDVKLVYFAVVGKQKEAKLFKGDVTHTYVMKGPQHFSAMFMNPNAIRRHGGGRVEMVGVQLFYRDRLFDQKSDPPSNQRWWELFTPQQETLLNPMQTPWAMIAHDHYEAVREAR